MFYLVGSVGTYDDYNDTREIFKFDPSTAQWTTLVGKEIISGKFHNSMDALLLKDVKDHCVC